MSEQPDLVIVLAPELSSGSVAAGNSISVEFGVINTELGTAPPSKAGVYLSTDSAVSTGDIYLGEISLPTIPFGTLVTTTFTLQIPATIPPGNYTLGVIADHQNLIAEVGEFGPETETDNISPGAALTVTASTGRPDLDVFVTPTLSSGTIVRGNTLSVHFEVDNLSGSTSGPFYTGVRTG